MGQTAPRFRLLGANEWLSKSGFARAADERCHRDLTGYCAVCFPRSQNGNTGSIGTLQKFWRAAVILFLRADGSVSCGAGSQRDRPLLRSVADSIEAAA